MATILQPFLNFLFKSHGQIDKAIQSNSLWFIKINIKRTIHLISAASYIVPQLCIEASLFLLCPCG